MVPLVTKAGACCLLSLMLCGCDKTPEPEPANNKPVGPQLSDVEAPAKSILDVPGAPTPNTTVANPVIPQPTAQAVGQPQEKTGSFDPNAVATKEEAEEWITQLNFMVSEYRGTFDKMPPDLEEFIRKGYFKNLPPAPAGKKYVLDTASNTVVLKDK
ncbi:MAG: hypothetical protein K0Q55_1129 [Verrucomicrobia bacterium]|nr:hypothetical protein [Verrucomicrobiota bacterium]